MKDEFDPNRNKPYPGRIPFSSNDVVELVDAWESRLSVIGESLTTLDAKERKKAEAAMQQLRQYLISIVSLSKLHKGLGALYAGAVDANQILGDILAAQQALNDITIDFDVSGAVREKLDSVITEQKRRDKDASNYETLLGELNVLEQQEEPDGSAARNRQQVKQSHVLRR